MAVSKKAVAKKREAQSIGMNNYAVLEGIDGNANTVKEFDEIPHDDDEVFFVAKKDADEDAKTRCLILNFIHQKLNVKMDRAIPYTGEDSKKSFEIYHREEYKGVKLDVCVFWPGDVDAKGRQQVVAMVKLASADMVKDSHWSGAIFVKQAQATKESKVDKHSKRINELGKFYWAPRWKYVINYLRAHMEEDFDKDGTEIIRFEPDSADEAEDDGGNGSTEEVEQVMKVFAGSTGQIIARKGAKIKEIRDATGIKDISLPPKAEDPSSRPRARDLVEIILKGTEATIAKARVLVQDVVDEWANAPRGNRNNNDSGGGSGSSAHVVENWGGDEPTSAANGGGDDSWGKSDAFGGGDGANEIVKNDGNDGW